MESTTPVPQAQRLWIAWGIAAILSIAVAVASVALWAGVPTLRTEHARSTQTMPTGPLVVTRSGKLFHRPTCKYIHGPATSITPEQAVAGGYTPCTRCMLEGAATPQER